LLRKHLGAPAYLLGVVLLLFPLLDAVLATWPPRAGSVEWRFGALGFLSRALITPLLGLVIVYAVALLLEHRFVQRVVAIGSGVLASVAGIAIVLLALDALQLRGRVGGDAANAFDASWLIALAKYGTAALLWTVLAFSAWRASRGRRPRPPTSLIGTAPPDG
jgi:hypothetical protein